ncbi:hypothetical protein [Brevibacillus thermoruber]|uniref:hypothetical protein n=1 Tax=Brevibacillus thermoruber TaxID=33942 RepID=UPI0012DFFB58|nr:hypothetical protein [Brevibacillus thermoruber]
MARQAAVNKQQMVATQKPATRKKRSATVSEEVPFVPFLRVVIKTGAFILDEREERYWKV